MFECPPATGESCDEPCLNAGHSEDVCCSEVDICNGECINMALNEDHCGACGRACEAKGRSQWCTDSKCFYGQAIFVEEDTTCSELCTSLGESCVDDNSGIAWTDCDAPSTFGCDVNPWTTSPPFYCTFDGLYCTCPES